MPAIAKGATSAAGGRAFAAPSYSSKGFLFGPWLGTKALRLINFPASVGVPPVGNPTSTLQTLTGSRLGRRSAPQ